MLRMQSDAAVDENKWGTFEVGPVWTIGGVAPGIERLEGWYKNLENVLCWLSVRGIVFVWKKNHAESLMNSFQLQHLWCVESGRIGCQNQRSDTGGVVRFQSFSG